QRLQVRIDQAILDQSIEYRRIRVVLIDTRPADDGLDEPLLVTKRLEAPRIGALEGALATEAARHVHGAGETPDGRQVGQVRVAVTRATVVAAEDEIEEAH